MINWKEKLSSRKFWACIGTEIGAIITGIAAADSLAARITCAVIGFGSMVAYVISETTIDKARIENQQADTIVIEKPVEDVSPDVCEGDVEGVGEN